MFMWQKYKKTINMCKNNTKYFGIYANNIIVQAR